jgi:diadenosine tetraphosphate (Ap4A) HIT family hydrolase
MSDGATLQNLEENLVVSATQTSAPCPFCDPPEDRVFAQDQLVIALWDGYPVSPGHALIIPRRHTPSLFDATEPEQSALQAMVNSTKAIIDERHHPDGYNIGVNVGAAAGQTVFHVHIHLIPRFVGDVDDPRGGVRHVIPAKANYALDLERRSIPTRGRPK